MISTHNPSNDSKEFTVEDVVPEFTELVSVSEGGQVDEEGKITWTKELNADETWEVSFVVKTLEFSTYIPNQADVSVDRVILKTNTVENWIPNEPLKQVHDERGDDANWEWLVAQDDREITYDIHWDNPKSSKGHITIVDELDPAIVFVEASDGGVYDENSHSITWELDVDSASSGVVQVKVKFDKTFANKKIENDYIEINDYFNHKSNKVINYLVDDPTTIDLKGTKYWDDESDKA